MNIRGPALAVLGLVASALVHAGAFWALAALVAPEQTPDQAAPQSRLDIVAQNIPRGEAAAVTPETESISQANNATPAAQQGTISRAQAPTVAPVPQRIIAVADKPDTLAPSAFTPAKAAAATRPEKTMPALLIKATAVDPAAVPTGTALAQTIAPAPQVAPTTPEVELAALAKGEATNLAASTPSATAAPAAALPETRQTAALAWSGDSENSAPLAAASLAAIAAFSRPEDAASGARELRDGIAGILASVPCARLQTVFIPETGTLEIRGHIPEDALRDPVLGALAAQVGGSIPLADQLLILPRPQCAALAGIAGIGLPQSTEQLTNPRVIGDEGFARNYTYANGQRLELELQAPDYPGYVYVDYFTADGMVIHLQPNEVVGLQLSAAKAALSVGKPLEGRAFLDLTIGPPFGQEIAAAFAASVPLYEDLRPLQEPAAAYLDFLRTQVEAARTTHPDFKGEWVYFFISTVPG